MGPTRKLRVLLQAHIRSDITHQDQLLNQNRVLSGKPIIGKRILPGATQNSNRKTLRTLLLLQWSQLGSIILMIHESGYAARSSTHSKYYNSPIPMRVVMNSGEYICMVIPTIKQRDLGGYKKIITCKSCSYIDSTYLHSQWQLRRIKIRLHLHQEGGWLLIIASNTRDCNRKITWHNSL